MELNKIMVRKTLKKKPKKTKIVKKSSVKNKKPVKKVKTNKPLKKTKKQEFIYTDIKGFDSLLGSGIPYGSSVLIEGGPGSGKTIFCLNVANNFCKMGKKVLYMSFEEPENKLLDHMERFGWDGKKYKKSGQLMIRRFNALDIARSVEALLSAAKKELLIDVQPMLFPENFKPDIILVDSLTSIASAFTGEENRFRIYMEQLFRYFEKTNITSLLIREVASPSHVGKNYVEKGEAISFLSDAIVVMYNVAFPNGKRARAIEILKMRGANIKRKIVEMEIVKKGIVVHDTKRLKGKYELT